MSKKYNKQKMQGKSNLGQLIKPIEVPSLLDAIEEGHEYGSIVSKVPPADFDIIDDVVRGIKEIQELRGHPCLVYVGNVVRKDAGDSGVDSSDDLPFHEMINRVPSDIKEVDIYLATRGGSAHQISRFVNCLRQRFDKVNFLIPSYCMSAGTLFALSGDNIFMTSRACLGPIDPQVPSKDGRFIPAQALITLINDLQAQGDQAMKKGQTVPWSAVRIIDSIDKKEIGDAISATNYSLTMAAQFIMNYKFRTWNTHSSNSMPVTPQEKGTRANDIAKALASHDIWKAHGHAISREVLWQQIKLKIEHPDAELERAMIRLWALFNWLFDKTAIIKCTLSDNYRLIRQSTIQEGIK